MKQIVIFLMFFFLTTHESFAISFNNLKISDSSQIDTNAINKIGVKMPSGGGIPLGTVIAWYEDKDPPENGCTSSKTGGDGLNGKCVWLECNGQSINLEAYPEYEYAISLAPWYNPTRPVTPEYTGTYSGYYTINAQMYGESSISYKKTHMDGIIDIFSENRSMSDRNHGSYGLVNKVEHRIYDYEAEFGYEKTDWTVKVPIAEKYLSTVRYLIRVSHPEPEK